MNITELIKFNKLQEENELLKKELAKKDKQIKNLEKEWEIIVCEKYDLQQTQLYKEDFIVSDFCINCRSELFYIDNIKKIKVNKNEKCSTCGWDKIIQLKDNSKYELLPSKDVK